MLFEDKLLQQVRQLVEEELDKLTKNARQKEKQYEIKVYHPDDEEWEKYIRPNRNNIFKFLDDGYKYAKLGDFAGCTDGKGLFKNANEIRIAFCDGYWVAISVYSGYRMGYKCVGITATTAKNYRNVGKRAVKDMILQDIRLYRRHYWTECSGVIENYYEQAHGIKLPSEFASEILGKPVDIVDNYHYQRAIGNEGKITKVIYGFNSKSTFDKVYSSYKDYIDKRRQRIEMDMLKESEGEDDILQQAKIAYDTIGIFDELYYDGNAHELPKESISMLKENIEKLRKLTQGNRECFNEEWLKTCNSMITWGETILENIEPMTIFTI